MKPEHRCTAKNSRGDPCGAPRIKGTNVCRVHGGSAPQVRAAAKQRLLEAADPAAARLVKIALDEAGVSHADQIRAITAVLDRAGLHPKQGVEVTGEDGGPVELVERLRAALAEESSDDDV